MEEEIRLRMFITGVSSKEKPNDTPHPDIEYTVTLNLLADYTDRFTQGRAEQLTLGQCTLSQ